MGSSQFPLPPPTDFTPGMCQHHAHLRAKQVGWGEASAQAQALTRANPVPGAGHADASTGGGEGAASAVLSVRCTCLSSPGPVSRETRPRQPESQAVRQVLPEILLSPHRAACLPFPVVLPHGCVLEVTDGSLFPGDPVGQGLGHMSSRG